MKSKLVRYGQLKLELAKRGVKEHRLRAALKNNLLARIKLNSNSRAYYNWLQACEIFNIKSEDE